MNWDWLREQAERRPFQIIGALAGLVFALMVYVFGLFWTLFIAACVITGLWIGRRLDEDPGSLATLLERIFSPFR
jgi:uncharacterized membrane protein